ncbi:hypothetical protein Sme01_67010 [Sphaerisporangium melleum]|uniref:Uncharacterized protein n=1 Tax=Sphaerisporangium melleum TaxID=321316 RepID=A0A917RGI6_9ACTN|nr:hypothetical protein [Sphaerisporangium melleum]GGL06716.1 hypothetical protein GCM10007964_56240 [Sphaerisporangium melleum]GII74225.1 hypothetical protein Sme01_67010 [Sphaerisporangium melleum]
MVTSRARGRWAALLLAGLTPVVAELSLGNPPLRQAWLLVLWVPIYGAGTVLIRELVRRTGGGWPAVLLLGAAYGIVEEGLALQALTSPTIYGVAGWAPRIFGLNSAYTELNIPYHAVFSVALPILLVDLIVPGLRDRPYLRRTGLVVAGVVFVLGALLLRSTTALIDPGYQAPPMALAAFVLVIAVLVVLALWFVPRSPGLPATAPGTVPAPPVVACLAGVAAFGYLALLFPFGGARHPAFTEGGWVVVPMVAAALPAVAAGVLVHRWTSRGAWRDRHGLALAGGALVAHTAFGVIANGENATDRVSLAALGVVMIGLLALLARRTR